MQRALLALLTKLLPIVGCRVTAMLPAEILILRQPVSVPGAGNLRRAHRLATWAASLFWNGTVLEGFRSLHSSQPKLTETLSKPYRCELP